MIFRMKCVKVEFDCCIVLGGLADMSHVNTVLRLSHFMVWELRISWFDLEKLMIAISAHMLAHQNVRSNKTNTSKQFNSVYSFGFDLERIIWIPNFWTEYLLNFLISKQIISRLFVFTQNVYSKRLLKMSIEN